MKKFMNATLEVVCFNEQDVVTTSGEFVGGGTYQDNELPLVPFSVESVFEKQYVKTEVV